MGILNVWLQLVQGKKDQENHNLTLVDLEIRSKEKYPAPDLT